MIFVYFEHKIKIHVTPFPLFPINQKLLFKKQSHKSLFGLLAIVIIHIYIIYIYIYIYIYERSNLE